MIQQHDKEGIEQWNIWIRPEKGQKSKNLFQTKEITIEGDTHEFNMSWLIFAGV